MNKKIIVAILITLAIVIVGFVMFFFSERTPFSVAEAISDLNIPSDVELLDFKDQWGSNGDGHSFVRFRLSEEQLNEIKPQMLNMKYKELPLVDLWNNYPQEYLTENVEGIYVLEGPKGNDIRDFELTVLNESKKELIVFISLQ